MYVYYTHAGSDNSCTDISDEINRVERYTMNGDVAQSAGVILDNIESLCGNHNGGSLNFGVDGMLYISTGDGGCDSNTAQNRNMLNGKILRINSDGSIPADNPYVNTAGSVVCAATAANPGGGFCRENYAYGLRNPFKTTLARHDPDPIRTRYSAAKTRQLAALYTLVKFRDRNAQYFCASNTGNVYGGLYALRSVIYGAADRSSQLALGALFLLKGADRRPHGLTQSETTRRVGKANSTYEKCTH